VTLVVQAQGSQLRQPSYDIMGNTLNYTEIGGCIGKGGGGLMKKVELGQTHFVSE